jgi:phosphate-selective porin OprO/OprP
VVFVFRGGLSSDWPVPAGINLYGDDMQQANAELAAILGRWTFQSEYLISSLQDSRTALNQPTGNQAVYHGGYIQLLCFLTDDHDHYDLDRASFDRVTPKCNMASPKKYGWGFLRSGAWQIGARYNYLDLDDSGFNGGILQNQTYGLNWFLNPNMKCQFNYMNTYRDVSATTAFPAGSG